MTTLETPPGRYGAAPDPGGKSPHRRRNVTILAVLALAFVVVVAWLALGNQSASVTYDTYGYKVVDGQTVTVSVDVTVAPGTPVECTVEAQNDQHAQVGSRDVDLGPSNASSARYTVTIQTSERAVTGLVDSCRITG
jgi:uncharacterized protein (DUF58 family)